MLTDFNSIILKFCEIGGENCDSRQHPMQKFLNKAKYFYARTTIVCLYGSHCIWWQCPHKIELYVYRIICICGRSAFVCLIPYRFDMLFFAPLPCLHLHIWRVGIHQKPRKLVLTSVVLLESVWNWNFWFTNYFQITYEF